MEQLYDISGNALSLRSLKQRSKMFDIDLTGCTLTEVMEECSNFKRKTNKRFCSYEPIIANIKILEQQQLDEGEYVMPEDVTDIFYNIFINFLEMKGLEHSTISSYCGGIRAALKWGGGHGVHLSPTYDNFDVRVAEKQRIALTPAEVAHIAYFDVATTLKGKNRSDYIKTMERVRDFFVLSCNLGQRYSDMICITPECFDRNIFTITQQKTGGVARVDIDKFSIDKYMTYDILTKYDYRSPYKGDISLYEKRLVQLLKMIGGSFCDLVQMDRKVNGVMERIRVPKYTQIRSHTSRRTFITVNALLGKREYQIRRCSGHKDLRAFQKYICIDE